MNNVETDLEKLKYKVNLLIASIPESPSVFHRMQELYNEQSQYEDSVINLN